jgi:heme/copper-type cytochrome/quinol oxidase subunit 2
VARVSKDGSLIKRPYIFIIVAIIIIGGVASLFAFNSLSTPNKTPDCTNVGKTVNFTIIESDTGAMEGMNGSYNQFYKGVYTWPVMKVQCNDIVHILIENRNSSEDHGFAIIHYFNAGVALSPGQSYTKTFVANKIGNFPVFCNIECAIHPFMQNGELIVTS